MDLMNELVRRGIHPDGVKEHAQLTDDVWLQLVALGKQLNAMSFCVPIFVGGGSDDGGVSLQWTEAQHQLVSAKRGGAPFELCVYLHFCLKRTVFAGTPPRSDRHVAASHAARLLPAFLDRIAEHLQSAERAADRLSVVQTDPAPAQAAR